MRHSRPRFGFGALGCPHEMQVALDELLFEDAEKGCVFWLDEAQVKVEPQHQI